jgi:hypothetical protein
MATPPFCLAGAGSSDAPETAIAADAAAQSGSAIVAVVEAHILARAAVTYTGVDGTTQHAPLVAASVGDVEMLFVLDTGSDTHILTKELVDRLGLHVDEGEEGVDHSGATMPSWSIADVSLAVGGRELSLREIVSIPALGEFNRLGIGGILSPQYLHPSGLTVLDLVTDALLVIDCDDSAAGAWLAKRSPGLSTLTLARDPDFETIVVSAAIRPYAAIPTLLNTGGKRTEFSRAAVPGIGAGRLERLGSGVSGSDVIGSIAGAQVIEVADHHVLVEQLAVREVMHDPQGMVGADVLRGTVLACAADRSRPVYWAVPPLEARDAG